MEGMFLVLSRVLVVPMRARISRVAGSFALENLVGDAGRWKGWHTGHSYLLSIFRYYTPRSVAGYLSRR
jgi:hypothetical protein